MATSFITELILHTNHVTNLLITGPSVQEVSVVPLLLLKVLVPQFLIHI